MFCAVLPAGVKGLDKSGELMSNRLISTDDYSAVQEAIAAFFPVF